MSKTTAIANAFIELGNFLAQFTTSPVTKDKTVKLNDLFFDGFNHQMKLAEEHNSWFTQTNIKYALQQWQDALKKDAVERWISHYNFDTTKEQTVALVTAGNIPLVGLHDVLSVLICGHKLLIKPSSNDNHLLPFITKYLEHVEPALKGKINYTKNKLTNFDAVIATGSNNTARYFDYYFRNYPKLIRKNRNSVAVLTGNETESDLKALSEDVFRYYGLGCRNVSKLFVPKNYDFDLFFKAVYHWHPLINQSKYANNYDYNKAVYLMSEFDILENGFLMLKEDRSNASPIATLFYEYYDTQADLKSHLKSISNELQVVVSKNFISNEIPFGTTQKPKLTDYADGVDTVNFLLKI